MTRPNVQPAGWMVASFLAALVLTSNGVVSAVSSTYVALTNSNGTRSVGITKAKQLLTAETDVGDIVRIQGYSVTSCSTLYTVPAGKNLIIKSAAIHIVPTTLNVASDTYVYLGDCSSGAVLLGAGHSQPAWANQTYGEGIVVPGGATASVIQLDGSGLVPLYGHLVPKASPAP